MLATLALCAPLVVAEARDADGSRLQASSVSLGSSSRDTLSPPHDRADWRSFKVKATQRVSLSVSSKPAKASVQLSLLDARGNRVASASSADGAASLSSSLEPGLYYVAVSASEKVSYSLNVN